MLEARKQVTTRSQLRTRTITRQTHTSCYNRHDRRLQTDRVASRCSSILNLILPPQMETRSSDTDIFTTSASASIHSRLSATSSGSQRRLRAPVRADSADGIPSAEGMPKFQPAVLESAPTSPEVPDLPLFVSPARAASRSSLRTRLYWIFSLYCAFCTALFTAHLFDLGMLLGIGSWDTQEMTGISPIDDFSSTYRMTRLLQMEPSLVSFVPFVFRARKKLQGPSVTACLWIESAGLKDLEHWATTWEGKTLEHLLHSRSILTWNQGPLSVVLITESDPHDSEPLIRRIKKLPNVKARANIHVLRRMTHEHRSSNAYLNLARLFARTRMVAIFPATPQLPIPKSLYEVTLANTSSIVNGTAMSLPLVLAPSKTTPKSLLPFMALSPLLVEQEYPVWCSERFFSAPSREEDWEECLWQFWINSYGTLQALSEPNWRVSRNRTQDSEGRLPVEVRLFVVPFHNESVKTPTFVAANHSPTAE